MRYKSIIIGGIIGEVYALVQSLISIYWLSEHGTSGDPGPLSN